MWSFFQSESWQILTALLTYIAGARLVVIERTNEASYGNRRQREPRMLAGIFLSGTSEIVGIGLLIWIAVGHGLVAALSSLAIAVPAAFLLKFMKSIFYPYME